VSRRRMTNERVACRGGGFVVAAEESADHGVLDGGRLEGQPGARTPMVASATGLSRRPAIISPRLSGREWWRPRNCPPPTMAALTGSTMLATLQARRRSVFDPRRAASAPERALRCSAQVIESAAELSRKLYILDAFHRTRGG
jgi:hypothetical protein